MKNLLKKVFKHWEVFLLVFLVLAVSYTHLTLPTKA